MLRDLLAKYGYSLKHVISLFDPQACRRASAAQSQLGMRKLRQMKVYKKSGIWRSRRNLGGHHKNLKEWKVKYGADTLESWLKK
ncbi:hypothetical protein D3C76_1380360 [compost metagenome]